MKKCTVCNKVKSLEEFHKKTSSKDGKASYCKACKALKGKEYYLREESKEKRKLSSQLYYENNKESIDEYRKKWREEHREYKKEYDIIYRQKNKERIISDKKLWHKSDNGKNYRLVKNFGITLEEYNKMFDEQKGLCYICSEADTVKLAVDHNHNTGAIRRLLCKKCNVAIGLLKEDPQIIENVLNYIKQFA
jgi:hypothetical protein